MEIIISLETLAYLCRDVRSEPPSLAQYSILSYLAPIAHHARLLGYSPCQSMTEVLLKLIDA